MDDNIDVNFDANHAAKNRNTEPQPTQAEKEQIENLYGRPDAEPGNFQNPENYAEIEPGRPIAKQPPAPEPLELPRGSVDNLC